MRLIRSVLRRLGLNPPPRITTVINFCTNDYRFIQACIQHVQPFSQEVIVPFTNFFYDGTPENEELLQKAQTENPGARFVFFPYDPDKDVKSQHWVTFARVCGWQSLRQKADYILFLDADEIVDTNSFMYWLKKYPLRDLAAVKLANYYYFRETFYQADTFEDTPLLAKNSLLTPDAMMDFLDRDGTYRNLSGAKARMVAGFDEKPMIHHYSWVRTREEMLRKVATWGHSHERNWEQLVIDEFETGFSGKDFVHQYQYRKVEPFVDIRL
jgi:hypothetical protein